MALITLTEYAKRLGKARTTVYAKYRRGGLKTAVKLGRDIWIDESEPYVDDRVRSGAYVGWRRGYQNQKALREKDQHQD